MQRRTNYLAALLGVAACTATFNAHAEAYELRYLLSGLKAVKASPPLVEEEAAPPIAEETNYSSCQAILAAKPNAQDGVYVIHPAGNAIEAYCDMTADGGGWTLVTGIDGNNRNHDTSSEVTPGNLLSPESKGKFSDTLINALLTEHVRFTCEGTTAYFRNIEEWSATRFVRSGDYQTAPTIAGPWGAVSVPKLDRKGLSNEASTNPESAIYQTVWSSTQVSNNGCFAGKQFREKGTSAHNGVVYVR